MNDGTAAGAEGARRDETEYLRMLGERIRDLRVRRGMTRRILARDSSVSERYLAQLEGGEGNISIIRLRQVASAMGIPLEDLVAVGPEPAPELTLLIQHLKRLPPARLSQARELLLSSTAGGDRRQRVALIGLRGAGKTTLGRRLAAHRGVPFIEMAEAIEREAGMSVSEIFSLSGQAAYRRFERRALQSVLQGVPAFVLAPGGSIVTEPATFDELLSSCTTIWLRASPEEHMARVIGQGDQRPMSDNQEAMADLQRILAGREGMYGKADAALDTSGRPADESFAELLRLLPA